MGFLFPDADQIVMPTVRADLEFSLRPVATWFRVPQSGRSPVLLNSCLLGNRLAP